MPPLLNPDSLSQALQVQTVGESSDRLQALRLKGSLVPDLTGLRDPDDPSKMNFVKRPVESA